MDFGKSLDAFRKHMESEDKKKNIDPIKEEKLEEVKKDDSLKSASFLSRLKPYVAPSPSAGTSGNNSNSYPKRNFNNFTGQVKTNMNSVKFTEEQEKVIECDAQGIKVKAFAGAGKTSTLVAYANKRLKGKGLYLAFNKDIKKEAMTKFPSNVKCMTSHGLAYSRFGVALQDKLSPYLPWESVYEGARVKAPFREKEANRMYSKILFETINNFVSSADDLILGNHIPLQILMILKGNKKLSANMPASYKIVEDAEKVWCAMIDPDNKKVFVTHDVYLKQMQLASPVLPYDYILLDEAQDSNPAILDLLEKQQGGKIFVGDPHQAIYGFRNAIDAMTTAKADKVLELSTSFRFGNNVADFANSILALKGETTVLTGLGSQDNVFYGKLTNASGKTAYIARYNSTLLKEAATYVGLNKRVYFAGGIDSLRLDLLEDLHAMYYNKGKPRDVMLSTFNSYDDFKEMVESTEDIEWLSRCKIMEEMGNSLPDKIRRLKMSSVDDASSADMVFSTAHKSKGLEFENVILADDFYMTPTARAEVHSMVEKDEIEEVNILYVAATRAKINLVIPEKFNEYWVSMNELLEEKNYQKNRLSNKLIRENLSYFDELVQNRKINKQEIQKKQSKSTLVISDDPFDD